MKRTFLALSLITFCVVTSSSVSASLSAQQAAVLALTAQVLAASGAADETSVDLADTAPVKDSKKLKSPFVCAKNKYSRNSVGRVKPNHKKNGTGFNSPAYNGAK